MSSRAENQGLNRYSDDKATGQWYVTAYLFWKAQFLPGLIVCCSNTQKSFCVQELILAEL